MSVSLRVVIVNQHPGEVLGGSEIQCDFIARGLRERGHETIYVAPTRDSGGSCPAPYRVVPVSRHPEALTAAVLSEGPDVVYWRFNKHGFHEVAGALYERRVPLVFAASHINDLTPWGVKPTTGLKGKLRQPLKRFRSWRQHNGFRYVDVVTVNNRHYLGRAPVPVQRFVPNGMVADVEPFWWPRPFCAWVANIKPAKRPEAAVRLAEDLEPLGIDVVMVGRLHSRHYGWLEDPAARPRNCHYLGPKSLLEVNGVLAESLLHVHTCEPEGFSNVFIQAWLQGRPSVSLGFDPGGYMTSKEIGVDAGNDYGYFSQAVRQLIRDPTVRTAMAARAQAFAQRTFSVSSLIDNVESVLARAMAAKGHGVDGGPVRSADRSEGA